jgi:hypothetical protein
MLVLTAALMLPALAFTQAPVSESRMTQDALLKEVRLLRQAMERQSAMGARAQLLVGRLALQDQRLGRSMMLAERMDLQASGAAQALSRQQREHTELRQALEDVSDPTVREATEKQLRDLKERVSESLRSSSDLQTRLMEARQTLDAERAKYEELEAAFQRLDRELEQPASNR